MIENDGDEVKGVGFITIHAAYLEAQIHQLLVELSPIEDYPEEQHKWQISKKIEAAKKRLKKLDIEKYRELIENLTKCKHNFEWRNEIVHSMILAPEYNENNLVSTRPGVDPRPIDVEEIYTLANNLNELSLYILHPLIFDIPKTVNEFIEQRARIGPIWHMAQSGDGHVEWPFDYTFDNSKVTCPRCLKIIDGRRYGA